MFVLVVLNVVGGIVMVFVVVVIVLVVFVSYGIIVLCGR